MRFNEETSMEPRVYEIVQNLVDSLAEHRNNAIADRERLIGVLTTIHALTGEVWTWEYIPKVGILYVTNEDDTERIIPSVLKFN